MAHPFPGMGRSLWVNRNNCASVKVKKPHAISLDIM